MSCTIRPLDASTWEAFAELAERHNGIFGGCGMDILLQSAVTPAIRGTGRGAPAV
jgi:hypothetical protein